MTARTVQLIGHTAGTALRVTWNGQQVFEGEISARGDTDNLAVLAEWQCDTAVTGHVPLKLENIGGGSLTFASIYMNHVRAVKEFEISDQAAWTLHQPTADELARDIYRLSGAEIVSKYGLDKSVVKSWLLDNELVATTDNFIEPFEITKSTDGKTNVMINNSPHERHSVHQYWGAWQWGIFSSDTLTCDILVDADIIQG